MTINENRIRVIDRNCKPEAAKDKSLPTSAFLVEYVTKEGTTQYDIVMAYKQVDIFDAYYDVYREGFRTITQASGNVKPKLWNPTPAAKK